MRWLICGDRNWTSMAQNMVMQALINFISTVDPEAIIIEGEARGADIMARKLALEVGLKVERYPADWTQYGKRAGPIRNQEMLDSKPDVGVACHNDIASSKGTKDMCLRMINAGKPMFLLTTKNMEILNAENGRTILSPYSSK